MTPSAVVSLAQQVLWASFFVAMAFGAVVQKTGFCTMGAITDAAVMDDWTRLRQWALAVGVATLGFGILAWSGLVDPARTLYASTRWQWLSALVGGLVFGFGMVLASGCPSKALVRLGGGSLKSLVVVIVMGVAAFATLKGITAVWRDATVDRVALEFATGARLPSWVAHAFGLDVQLAGLLLALALGGGLVAWAFAGPEFLRANNLLAGGGIGLAVVAMWFITGWWGHLAEHPETLEEISLATTSGRAEGLSFVSPIAYALDWLMFYSDRSKVLTVGIVAVFGVIAGSAVTALATRRFRWEGFGGTSDLAHHLLGAVLMGVGGVTALGCSIGQGISGVSTLSATSIVAAFSMIAGARAALGYQDWRVARLSAT